MNLDLQFQRMQMTAAIGWLNLIETCDNNIKEGIDVKYFKNKREYAIEKYATSMQKLMGQALEISKILVAG